MESKAEKTLKGCVINRVWFDQARSLIQSPAGRCEFYECIMCAAFGLSYDEPSDIVVRTAVAMVLPYVMADVERYQDKCAKNRENALRRSAGVAEERPQATASDRKRPQTTAANINTNTNISTNNNTKTNLSTEGQRDREIFDCMGVIFGKDVEDWRGEFRAFWAYYESLGWCNGKGAPIVNKKAAAAMWRVKGNATGNLQERAAWLDAFKRTERANCDIWKCFRSLSIEEIEGARTLHITLACGQEFVNVLEDAYVGELQRLMRAQKCDGIIYHIAA